MKKAELIFLLLIIEQALFGVPIMIIKPLPQKKFFGLDQKKVSNMSNNEFDQRWQKMHCLEKERGDI